MVSGLRYGHQVSAFVRDRAKLNDIFAPEILEMIRICEGDALDEDAVGQAMEGQEACVNVAQHPADPAIFEAICQNIISQAEVKLDLPRRLWLFGGLPGLDVPHTKTMGADLPGMSPILRSHKVNFERLRASGLNWSFMCPGPMTFAPERRFGDQLRVTTEEMPYTVGAWTRWLPRLAHSLIMLRHLPEVTVSYEDVADLVIAHLEPEGPYSFKRVGVAAPKK